MMGYPPMKSSLVRPLTAEEARTYPEGAVVRAEDMGPVERAYAEAMHEDCEDGPLHPFSDHSPWSGGDLDGTEPWSSFMDRLARHGLTLTPVADTAGIDAAWAEAEAALEPGRTMDLVLENHVDGGRYLAWTTRRDGDGIVRREGPTPAAALLALAAALRTPKPEGEPE